MYKHIIFGAIAVAAVAGAQTYPRRAAIVGGGNPNGGQCTVEVVVDGAAEVEIRGADATIRNLSGQAPQWRRFECTSPMPANAADFRFAGVDGRGKQQLVRDPRNGGAAVVRIEDQDNGSEAYTFNVTWGGYTVTQDRGPVGVRDDRGFNVDRGPSGPPNDRDFNRDRGPVIAQNGPTDRDFNRDRGFSGPPNDRDFGRDRGRPDVDSYHRDRDTWFRGDNWRSMFFQRVREDLDHATSGAFPFTGDRARLARTQMELDELQQKLSRGFFDQRELDEVTASMQAVLQSNRLAPDDRAMLTDDLSRMRDFRLRHDQYGARDIEGAYHQDRDRQFRGNNWRAMFFQRIQDDLDHVASTAFPFGRDQSRLARTKFELDELQQKLSQGVYDERELDEAMASLQGVVQSNRLDARDRNILTDDLTRMRDFRMRHEQYGAR
jgi:hypothetical protein